MRFLSAFVLLSVAACGGHSKTPAMAKSGPTGAAPGGKAPGAIDGPGIGPGMSKCGAMAKDALCKCMVEDDVSVCDFADDGKLPVHVLRAGNSQQTDTFLVVEQGDKLQPVTELLYEQHHGKRDSDLSEPHLELQTIKGSRVVRVEYKAMASTDYANEEYDELLDMKAVKVCVLDGKGAPSCPVETQLTCTVTQTDRANPPNPAHNAKGASSARVDIGANGTVTVSKLSETGSPADCAVKPATVHLVP